MRYVLPEQDEVPTLLFLTTDIRTAARQAQATQSHDDVTEQGLPSESWGGLAFKEPAILILTYAIVGTPNTIKKLMPQAELLYELLDIFNATSSHSVLVTYRHRVVNDEMAHFWLSSKY